LDYWHSCTRHTLFLCPNFSNFLKPFTSMIPRGTFPNNLRWKGKENWNNYRWLGVIERKGLFAHISQNNDLNEILTEVEIETAWWVKPLTISVAIECHTYLNVLQSRCNLNCVNINWSGETNKFFKHFFFFNSHHDVQITTVT